MLETIIVTEKEYRKAEEVFRKSSPHRSIPASENEAALSAAVLKEGARAVIIGIERYTGSLYRALAVTGDGRGSVIARFGVGHDGVDTALARQNGSVVCNTPGALDLSVAEHAMWLMGCLARRVSQSEAHFRAGNFGSETGSELNGKRLGILGFGRIGRRVASMAHFGLGMSVWAANSTSVGTLEQLEKRNLAQIQKAYGIELYTNKIEQLMAECDYVSVHLPAIPATRNFINGSRLTLMKRTASLINTARGWVLDEAALYDALAAKRIAGAALDVFEHEPYRPVAPDKDLRKLSNVVLTPHIGSNTREANQRMAEACLVNIGQFFAGRLDQLTQVNPRKQRCESVLRFHAPGCVNSFEQNGKYL
jgi:lactate dehydrogenase-like 2-hydroxyacid dehydrogenase